MKVKQEYKDQMKKNIDDSLHGVLVIIISRCSVSTYLIRWRDVHINGVIHDNLRR